MRCCHILYGGRQSEKRDLLQSSFWSRVAFTCLCVCDREEEATALVQLLQPELRGQGSG